MKERLLFLGKALWSSVQLNALCAERKAFTAVFVSNASEALLLLSLAHPAFNKSEHCNRGRRRPLAASWCAAWVLVGRLPLLAVSRAGAVGGDEGAQNLAAYLSPLLPSPESPPHTLVTLLAPPRRRPGPEKINRLV